MSERATRPYARWIVAGLMALAMGSAGAQNGASNPPLRVCVADDNAPFSGASGADRGIDVDLAEELGRRLTRTVQLDWIRIPNRGGLGKALNQSLAKGQCDVFAGIPYGGEVRADLAEKGLAVSAPYLAAAYVLVQAPGHHLTSLSDLHRVAHLGAVTATPADLYLFQAGLHRTPYGSNRDLVTALAKGEVDAAPVWSPALARLKADGVALWPDAVVPDVHFSGEMKTRFVLALRADEPDLLARVNTALAAMKSDGVVRSVADRYGLPLADAP
ncbi:transporter substrate-binding domain-containing protein [Nitrogeniibacter mangrovi]|uniref:Transporter substrate-binding domain-containing protein n=1 Tax=Nitrogeniibacter mangrovi TaxID=2016596 RepID=A0A6C1B210_9RHOO|nr:transporter substrate-binding domain-containing protein [Nitrogeniibacter mangrovi]QID16935.1 transporter substrate-binding domain-containing protein [Nitrogeniibacter mangrovi]